MVAVITHHKHAILRHSLREFHIHLSSGYIIYIRLIKHNAINYYIAHGKSDSRLLDEKAECIEVELATVNRNAERIVYEIAKLQDKMIVEAR